MYSSDRSDFEGGRRELEEAYRRAKDARLSEDVIRILINFVESMRDLKRYDEAAHYAAEATAFLGEHESALYRHLLESRVAQLALTTGRWDVAASAARALLDGPSRSNHVRGRALEVTGRLRARRGEPGAWDALDEALALIGPGEMQELCPVLGARAEAAWLAGDLVRAGAEAMTGFELSVSVSPVTWDGQLSFLAWRAGRIERLPDDTDAGYRLHAAGRFREAAAAWREMGCPYEAALALSDSADEGDLREALDGLLALGATVMAKRVAHHLVALGARNVPRGPRPNTRANPAGLSAREKEVLELIGQGASNADIAERLVLSPKTVDNHVSAILRKLGVHDRHAAIGEARRRSVEYRYPGSLD
jgi:DNA-binding CsgD family transcriptional regulator